MHESRSERGVLHPRDPHLGAAGHWPASGLEHRELKQVRFVEHLFLYVALMLLAAALLYDIFSSLMMGIECVVQTPFGRAIIAM